MNCYISHRILDPQLSKAQLLAIGLNEYFSPALTKIFEVEKCLRDWDFVSCTLQGIFFRAFFRRLEQIFLDREEKINDGGESRELSQFYLIKIGSEKLPKIPNICD